MSDIIRLLPDSVANQIAAGEVIQRPASVIKELVENSIDAGATSVEVIIRDAGRTLIQVVDNGRGMSDTDARMAFERHATSKIQKADDLFGLHTMGFRGEALASICAVAQVDLRTRTADSDVGTRLIINGSKVESQLPEACQKGCNLMVKNLFFNVPARRKFLKKDAVEFTNIAREFERMALVNPQVDITLIHNDTVVHQLLRGSLKRRISDLFGKGLEKQLIPVSTSTSIVTIDGFIGRPEHARRRNALQYLTVNGRHMRHPYFHKAIMQCYEQLISSDEQPNYFLNFTVDPATIDVNIHPTKNEIKFENEVPIWQILVAAVKESLGRFNAVPAIDFETEGMTDIQEIPVYNPNENASHGIDLDTSYNPFAEQRKPASQQFNTEKMRRQAVSDWDKLYEGFMGASSRDAESQDAAQTLPEMDQPAELSEQAIADNQSIQIKNHYILAPALSGVMVVDQHRAHVRVLYNRYLSELSAGQPASQQVMFAEAITLDPQSHVILQTLEPELRGSGFDLSYLGDTSWSIVAVPTMIGEANPKETLTAILSDVSEQIPDTLQEIQSRFALAMARSGAIRAGRRLSAQERETLLGELLRLPEPNFTPDGLPVIRLMSEEEIGKLF